MTMSNHRNPFDSKLKFKEMKMLSENLNISFSLGLFRRGRGSRERTLARVNLQQDQDEGYHKTDVTFPRHPMMGMRSPKATCVYGFYIAYVRGNR